MLKVKLNKTIIILGVLSLVAVVEISVFTLEVKQLISLNKETSDLKAKLKRTEEEWRRKEVYLARIETLKKEKMDSLAKSILAEEVPGLLSFISSESKNFNVEINSLKPGSLEKYASLGSFKFYYLPLNIEAQGNFHRVANFLNFLQQSRYFFEIRDLEISGAPPQGLVSLVICALVREE